MVIAIVTGTRAEWGLFKPLVDELCQRKHRVLVYTIGAHGSPHFDLTEELVQEDHDAVVSFETMLDSDTATGVTKSSALAMLSLADQFKTANPELVIVLGDRSETLAAATVAFDAGISIAHIHGGEETRGSQDDARRNAITLMAEYHFAATERAAVRISELREKALGVDGGVWMVGSLGVNDLPEPKRDKGARLLLLYHPATNLDDYGTEHLENLLQVMPDAVDVIGSNADQGGRWITGRLMHWVESHQWNRTSNHIPKFRINMSRAEFLSVLNDAKAVVGNSSAGIIEAPALLTPTINVGPRQRGRECAESIIHASGSVESIKRAFQILHSREFQLKLKGGDWPRPYGEGGAAGRIADAIDRLPSRGGI